VRNDEFGRLIKYLLTTRCVFERLCYFHTLWSVQADLKFTLQITDGIQNPDIQLRFEK